MTDETIFIVVTTVLLCGMAITAVVVVASFIVWLLEDKDGNGS